MPTREDVFREAAPLIRRLILSHQAREAEAKRQERESERAAS